MLARWQVLDIKFDSYAVGCFGKRGGANALALRVLHVDREWLRCGVGGWDRDAAGQDKQTHKIRDNVHRSSLYLPGRLLRSNRSRSVLLISSYCTQTFVDFDTACSHSDTRATLEGTSGDIELVGGACDSRTESCTEAS